MQANIQSAAGALSPSDKEAWHETDHSPPLSAEFNNTQSLLPFAHKSSGPILRNYFIGIRPKCGADTYTLGGRNFLYSKHPVVITREVH